MVSVEGLVRTRQGRGQLHRTSSDKGVLRPREAAAHFDLRRYAPSADVGRYVERYWTVHWDLAEGETYQSQVLTHPSVNVTFIPGVGAEVYGVVPTTYTRSLSGRGEAFGVKFRPGGFYPFADRPVASLTDRSVPMRDVFGPDADALCDAVLAETADTDRAPLVEQYLRRRLPAATDRTYELVLDVVTAMLDDRTVTRVDQVADRFGMSVRSLQRLFHRYVGVGPKWMIRRYRLHDGAELLASGQVRDPAALAVELGWFDQAHFTRDFTALIGTSPVEYAAACAASADREPALVPVS